MGGRGGCRWRANTLLFMRLKIKPILNVNGHIFHQFVNALMLIKCNKKNPVKIDSFITELIYTYVKNALFRSNVQQLKTSNILKLNPQT